MSFLDEEIEDRPRRTSRRRPPPRGPGVDPQTLWVRRLIAIGVGVLILVLLVWGIHSCQVSRKHSAFRNYNRDVAALLQESDQQSGELFNLLRNPSGNAANPVDVTNNANGVRVQPNSSWTARAERVTPASWAALSATWCRCSSSAATASPTSPRSCATR